MLGNYLILKSNSKVYGIASSLSFDDLDRLYGNPISNNKYYPIQVKFTNINQQQRLTLCYVTKQKPSELPKPEYKEIIINEALKNKFPQWYINNLAEF